MKWFQSSSLDSDTVLDTVNNTHPFPLDSPHSSPFSALIRVVFYLLSCAGPPLDMSEEAVSFRKAAARAERHKDRESRRRAESVPVGLLSTAFCRTFNRARTHCAALALARLPDSPLVGHARITAAAAGRLILVALAWTLAWGSLTLVASFR